MGRKDRLRLQFLLYRDHPSQRRCDMGTRRPYTKPWHSYFMCDVQLITFRFENTFEKIFHRCAFGI